MLKSKCFAIIVFAAIFAIVASELSFARAATETPRWQPITISDNFILYNVLYNRLGEKIGVQETITPMYGQDIVIVYRADDLENGRSARISIYDSDMEYVFSKSVIIANNEIRAEVKLLSNRKKLESLAREADLQYFCIIDLPDSRVIRSNRVSVNFNIFDRLEYYNDEHYSEPEKEIPETSNLFSNLMGGDESIAVQEIDEQGYTVPRYYFTVRRYGDSEISERSPLLVIRNVVQWQLADDTGSIVANTRYIIHLSDGTVLRGITDENGRMERTYLDRFTRARSVRYSRR